MYEELSYPRVKGSSSLRLWQFQLRILQREAQWEERGGRRQPGDIQSQSASLNMGKMDTIRRREFWLYAAPAGKRNRPCLQGQNGAHNPCQQAVCSQETRPEKALLYACMHVRAKRARSHLDLDGEWGLLGHAIAQTKLHTERAAYVGPEVVGRNVTPKP